MRSRPLLISCITYVCLERVNVRNMLTNKLRPRATKIQYSIDWSDTKTLMTFMRGEISKFRLFKLVNASVARHSFAITLVFRDERLNFISYASSSRKLFKILRRCTG